jgi:thiosulfate dehydrogenase [quinone] large subunit
MPMTTIPGIAILPLRIFLGITFIYAGCQKITDPGFFRVGSPTYIGTQLLNFSNGSPIHFFMVHLLEHAPAIGVLTIGTEMLIGTCVLLGLFTRPAAILGLLLSLTFFLTASWHVYPYFLGSDIVFVMCWLTLALTGPGAYYLDGLIGEPLNRLVPGRYVALILGPSDPARARAAQETEQIDGTDTVAPAPGLMTRGEVLIAGAATAVLVVLGLVPRGSLSHAGSAAPPAPAPAAKPGASSAPAGMKKVGNISQLPVNTAGALTDPKSGDPAVIVHTTGSKFFAYEAVCTHAGCTVQYDPSSKLLVCPCHGGAFDPAQNAQVVAGPPPSPLTPLPMTIDAKGNIYLA